VIAGARDSFDGSWLLNSIGDIGDTAGHSNGGGWTLRIDDNRYAMRVEGRPFAESVPEPSTGALLAGSVLGAARPPRLRDQAIFDL
jgi:hypothetical protein